MRLPSAIAGSIRRLAHRPAHVSWAMLDQAVVSGSNFLTSIMLARIIGLTEFGEYTLALTTLLLIQGVQHAAINSGMLTMGPKQRPENAPAYYGVVFVLAGVFVAFATVAVWIGAVMINGYKPDWHLGDILAPLCAAVFACLIHDFLRRYFYSKGQPRVSFVLDAIRYAVQTAVLMIFLFERWPADSATALWIMVVTSTIAACCAATFVRDLAWPPSDFRSILVRKWHFAKWMTASALLSWAATNAYVMVSGALLGAATVGGIQASQNIVGVTHLLIQGLENVVPAESARRLGTRGPAAVSAYLRQVAVKGALATALIACSFALFPQFWLTLLFGDAFRPYANLVRWWAVWSLLYFLTLPLSSWLRTFERTRLIFFASLATSLVSVTLAYPLITSFGATGALAGIVVSTLVQLSFLMFGIRWEKGKRTDLARFV